MAVALTALSGCAGEGERRTHRTASPSASATGSPSPSAASDGSSPTPSATPSAAASAPAQAAKPAPPAANGYPWHHGIVSTTFWVGEIFDPNAADGSQMVSTYDSDWYAAYGGCDGVTTSGGCETEARSAPNGWFPVHMTPKQNSFYLDLPYDDVNDATGFAERDRVVPWAAQQPYAAHRGDAGFSYLKNRWVELSRNGRTCYGQIEDAGPALYHDAAYVFGTNDARPASKLYNNAGMDVSPALTGCLGFPELNGESGVVDWRFVDAAGVPAGPWTRLVTTSQVR